MKEYRVIGVMSGTSLDGLDIACCRFRKTKRWAYQIEHAMTIPYTPEFRAWLGSLYSGNRKDLKSADTQFGKFIGDKVLKFIRRKKLKADLVASHGHTIFHDPRKGVTLQIGNGQIIADLTGLPVVYDFRSADVKLGGQGAPLVPMADRHLFSDYTYCLNLGGFANVSFEQKAKRVAFDVCPVNMALNHLAGKRGKAYDAGGRLAAAGKTNMKLLKALDNLSYYKEAFPKSLGREWFERKFMKTLNAVSDNTENKLSTVVEHIARQIARCEQENNSSLPSSWLVSGGGALNKYLIKRMKANLQGKLIIPDAQTIQFKEALAFAFLGVLKWRGEVNILKSVTGARKDSSGGVLVKPKD